MGGRVCEVDVKNAHPSILLGILEQLMNSHPALPVVMISGHGTIETAVTAIKMGAYDFIEKPFKADRLLLMIKRAIDTARLTRENAELRLRTGAEWEMIGDAQSICQVRQTIARVAPTQSRVLITGPPGVGKTTTILCLARHLLGPAFKGNQYLILIPLARIRPSPFRIFTRPHPYRRCQKQMVIKLFGCLQMPFSS